MDLAIVLGGAAAALLVIAIIDIVAGRPDRRAGVMPAPARGAAGERRPARVMDGLRTTRERLAARLASVVSGSGEETYERLEEALVAADVGVATARELVARVRRTGQGGADGDAIREALRREMVATLKGPTASSTSARPRPLVILVTGVNGVGKTTTVGKLAARHRDLGERVMVIAADTFRAAAGDQLEAWAHRLGVEIVRQREGGTPASVVFDGMAAAKARDVDVVLIDTAGRLHTRKPLVEELRKVRRVVSDAVPGAPHTSLIVLDATTGQNALSQARVFMEAVDLTGVVLTKLDGTARGGMALAVAHELGLPIEDVGVGEGEADLRPFDAEEFVDALLGEPG